MSACAAENCAVVVAAKHGDGIAGDEWVSVDRVLPEDVREKIRGSICRIVNEGATGLICLIL